MQSPNRSVNFSLKKFNEFIINPISRDGVKRVNNAKCRLWGVKNESGEISTYKFRAIIMESNIPYMREVPKLSEGHLKEGGEGQYILNISHGGILTIDGFEGRFIIIM